jgi:hypothetical protein
VFDNIDMPSRCPLLSFTLRVSSRYGGVDHRAECGGLPKYPVNAGPMTAAGDDLISLCEYGFDRKVRGEGGTSTGRRQWPETMSLHGLILV